MKTLGKMTELHISAILKHLKKNAWMYIKNTGEKKSVETMSHSKESNYLQFTFVNTK